MKINQKNIYKKKVFSFIEEIKPLKFRTEKYLEPHSMKTSFGFDSKLSTNCKFDLFTFFLAKQLSQLLASSSQKQLIQPAQTCSN